MDRVGLPEDELPLAEEPRHDPGSPGLPHVASLWPGMLINLLPWLCVVYLSVFMTFQVRSKVFLFLN